MVGLYHFEWSWTTPNSNFNVTPLFDAEYLRNGTTDRHSYNEILIWDLHTPDWREGVISSDLEWLSEIFSGMKHIVRSLCDSWASCYEMRDIDIGMLSVWRPSVCLSLRLARFGIASTEFNILSYFFQRLVDPFQVLNTSAKFRRSWIQVIL